MDNKRSYLDTLNAGRQRRPHTTLEDLNRSLETLEARLDRSRDPLPGQESRGRERQAPRPDYGQPAQPARSTTSSHEAFDPRAMARDLERIRSQEDSIAAASKIALELKGLREELHQQMSSGLKREFETLRKEIERAYQSATASHGGEELGLELERLSGAIQSLAARSDDKNVSLLRLELDQVRAAVDTLAREDTLKSVDRRWDDFDRRWSDFETRVSADFRTRSEDPAIAALTGRLEQINQAVNNLPESLSLKSLEEKVRTLAGAIDHFAKQQDRMPAMSSEIIEERLDEISRAIIASAVSTQAPSFDAEPFERIEARITALAKQIEEIVDDRPGAEVIDRLNMLSQRVDEIAVRTELPEKSVERLARQIATIVDKLDAAPSLPDTDEILRGVEQRFELLSAMIERRQDNAAEQAGLVFRDLERRLDQVAERLDHRAPEPQFDDGRIMDAIDARFNELTYRIETRKPDRDESMRGIEARLDEFADRLDRRPAEPAFDDSKIMGAIDARFNDIARKIETRKPDRGNDELIRGIEARLDEVADRLARRPAEPAFDDARIMGAIDARFNDLTRKIEAKKPDRGSEDVIRNLEARLESISSRLQSSTEQVERIDPELLRGLQSQVAGLTTHLSRPAAPLPVFEDMAPRLDRIEKSITSSRETVVDAARKAAEEAIRALGASKTDAAAVAGLNQDLKALETLTRRSDERNAKTFEAIHDTLLKIVDRLGSLEHNQVGTIAAPAAAAKPARKLAINDAPSIEPDAELPVEFEPRPRPVKVDRTPAEAAQAAAVAALDTDKATEGEGGSRVRSMFGGLTRAFSRKEPEQPVLAGSAEPAPLERQAPKLDLDQPLDPKVANRPLEPGSGAPDLSAIMKRVRDERGQPVKHSESDAAKSDFIAAARRAAQAAAAETDILKRNSDLAGPVRGLKIGDILKRRRKPLMMTAAAVLIALAGLQLGKAFMSDRGETADIGSSPAASEQPAGDAAPMESAAPAEAVPEEDPIRVVGEEPAGETPRSEMVGGAAPVEITPPAEPAMASDAPAADAAADAPAAPVEAAAVESAPPATESTAPPVEAKAAIEKVPVEAGPAALREAAEAGDAKALFEVGSRYAEGRGVKADMAAAAKWYEKSAELGFAPAQYRIGNFHEKGLGVERDIPKSKTWYQLAASQGNASAMHNLAVLYAMGADGTADNESAARWFLEAGELGVKDSQFNLGILNAKGVGVQQNLEESYKWFALVAKTGDRDASAKRDEIANSLRPEQLEKARAATELWKAKPLNPEANTVDIPESWQESNAKTASIATPPTDAEMKKAVRNIQAILNKNGYDAGAADGVMGDKTKMAIAAFQKDNGMEPTGAVDEKLVKELLAKK